MTNGPFSGITILDLTSVISGPFATAILGDQGARVIKVEGMSGDTLRFGGAMRGDMSSLFMSMNRNKESIAIDLRQKEGVELVMQLAEKADVCIQNYRPGVVDRLGIGYDAMKAINPSIVYGSISGAGASGPYADRRFYDPVIQAYAGFANAQSFDGEPQLIKMMLCDKITALTMAQALSAALYHRATTGEGRHVEVSMLEACLYFFWPDRMITQTYTDELDVPAVDPYSIYRVVPTSDGFITFIVISVEEFRGLANALDRKDWLEDPRFDTTQNFRMNYADIYPEIVKEIASRTTAQLSESFQAADVPFGVVLNEDSILEDPQVLSEGIVITHQDDAIGGIRAVNRNIRFSGLETGFRRPAPALNGNADDLLTELGQSVDDIGRLREKGIIGS